jgi:hypothetical protein
MQEEPMFGPAAQTPPVHWKSSVTQSYDTPLSVRMPFARAALDTALVE